MKNAVQKASNFFKDNAKYAVMIGVTALYGLGGETARGGSMQITNNSTTLGETYAYNNHFSGATENYDESFDFPYDKSSPAQLHIYTYNNICDSNLAIDSRGIKSITPFEIKLKAKNLFHILTIVLNFKLIILMGLLIIERL